MTHRLPPHRGVQLCTIPIFQKLGRRDDVLRTVTHRLSVYSTMGRRSGWEASPLLPAQGFTRPLRPLLIAAGLLGCTVMMTAVSIHQAIQSSPSATAMLASSAQKANTGAGAGAGLPGLPASPGWSGNYSVNSSFVSRLRQCFPSDSIVQLQGGRSVRMHQLKRGDIVRVGPEEFEPVYFFSHQDRAAAASFVQISVAGLVSSAVITCHAFSCPPACVSPQQKLQNGGVILLLLLKRRRHSGVPARRFAISESTRCRQDAALRLTEGHLVHTAAGYGGGGWGVKPAREMQIGDLVRLTKGLACSAAMPPPPPSIWKWR